MEKLCECGCGIPVRRRFASGHNSKVAHPMKGRRHSAKSKRNQSETIRRGGRKSRLCVCGCGGKTALGRKYVHGHNTRGKPRPPEVRRRISEAQRGHSNLTPEQIEKMRRGVVAAWKNPASGYHKPGYKAKLSVKTSLGKGGTGVPRASPPRGLGWTRELRLAIRVRDRFICQEPGCRERGLGLSVHHINYVSWDHRPENLIALCSSHHGATNVSKSRREHFRNRYKAVIRARGWLAAQK